MARRPRIFFNIGFLLPRGGLPCIYVFMYVSNLELRVLLDGPPHECAIRKISSQAQRL